MRDQSRRFPRPVVRNDFCLKEAAKALAIVVLLRGEQVPLGSGRRDGSDHRISVLSWQQINRTVALYKPGVWNVTLANVAVLNPPHRTQEQRRAETQAKLLEATIQSLLEDGYAQTTTRHV